MFYRNTKLFSTILTGAPSFSYQSPAAWPSTSVKVGNAFYWVSSSYSRLFKYITPSSPGAISPSAYYALPTFATIAYDPVKQNIWIVKIDGGAVGETIKFDLDLNVVSTHPIATAGDGFTSYPALCIYNGIGAIVASASTLSVNNRFSIRDYNVADTVAPTVVRNEVATVPGSGAPSSALLTNGYAYYGEVLIDLISTVGPAPAPVTTLSWNALSGLTFKLWVNKQLLMTKTITSSGVFRMPAGYKSDTFEVSVEGDVRVRSIHLAETPTSLENV